MSTTIKPAQTVSAAFDDLDDAHTALEGVTATVTQLLDHTQKLDAAVAFAIERQLKAETANLGAAIEKAREICEPPPNAAPASGTVPTLPPDRTRRPFDVLDPVMQRWVDVKGVIATLLCGLDGDPDKAAVGAMRRYAEADLDGLDTALKTAWSVLVQGNSAGAQPDGSEGGTQ